MTTKAENLKTRPDLDDETWLAWTAAQPENRGIHVRELYRKMLEWCMKKGVTPTRKRLLRWLDTERDAVPLTYEPPYFAPECAKCGNTGRVQVNDLRPPCPACKPDAERAFWKARGK